MISSNSDIYSLISDLPQDNVGNDTSHPSPVHRSFDRKVLSRLTVAQLKEELVARGVNTAGCRRKPDFIELLLLANITAQERPSVSIRIHTHQLVYTLNLDRKITLHNPRKMGQRVANMQQQHRGIPQSGRVLFYLLLLLWTQTYSAVYFQIR